VNSAFASLVIRFDITWVRCDVKSESFGEPAKEGIREVEVGEMITQVSRLQGQRYGLQCLGKDANFT